jgi:glyoxylase-like metal-dependent hydrolase (beta-lactamase superfamily II)
LTIRSSRFDLVESAAHTGRPRRQEQEPAAAEVIEVAPGILRSQLPISLPGLGHVNCYFLQDERGVAIVDPGLPGPASWRALVDRLKQAGYKPRHVHTVVVTHSHPDHFGGAGRLRDTYGAEVVSHRSFRTWFDPAEDEVADDEPTPPPWGRAMPWRSDATFTPPLSRRLKLGFFRTALRRFVRTPAPTKRVDDAEVITLAGREWVSLHTPGHTNDHLCLFDATEGVVLSGDHVLPTITPHISGLVAGADPLTEFFASLDKVAALDGVDLVLPAHGHPFHDLAGRAKEIQDHHQERLDVLRKAAGELGSASVEELSHHLFKPRSWGQMAESETYAHLEHLRAIGEAESRDDAGTLHYSLIG